MSGPSFRSWVKSRRRAQVSIGEWDFVKDVRHDPDFPVKAQCWREVHEYLVFEANACERAVEVAERLWKRYVERDGL